MKEPAPEAGVCTFLPTGERFFAGETFLSSGNWTVAMRGNGKVMNMTSATADKWQCEA